MVCKTTKSLADKHYLLVESEDLDEVLCENYVRYHTYYETKLKALENLDLTGSEFVLDVGCGQGYLLKLISKFYPNINCIGIDLNLKDLKKPKIEMLMENMSLFYVMQLTYP